MVTPQLMQRLEPDAYTRAERKILALELLQAGRTAREVRNIVAARYSVTPMTAWRIVQAARDLICPQ